MGYLWVPFFPGFQFLQFSFKVNNSSLNVRPDTIRLLEEKIARTLSDINCSNIFFDPPPRVMKIKTKINIWDLIKLKSFCTTKETIKKMKRQPTEWEKIFANEATDKRLISKIYTSCNSISKKQTSQSKKWAEDLNRHFSREGIQMANKHMKRCSTSLIIKEMQIKTTMRYHLTPVRMAIIKKIYKWDFPGGPVATTPRSQCRGPGFDPWSGN